MSAEENPLCQYFTPLWVAEALIERHFPALDSRDVVLEPSAGMGAFLSGIPAAVRAIGVEIDPKLAAIARAQSGRDVICGDFRTVELPVTPTAIIGNPPFAADLIDEFLARSYRLLPEGGRAGFILPTYMFQTAERVCRYADQWSITHELLPRNAFHARMQTPLLFAIFSKDARRLLIGFSLYRECADVKAMQRQYRDLIESAQGSLWRAVCELALKRLGGEADLPAIYREIERNRPSTTKFWREKIRQTLRHYGDTFTALATGRYALRAPVEFTLQG